MSGANRCLHGLGSFGVLRVRGACCQGSARRPTWARLRLHMCGFRGAQLFLVLWQGRFRLAGLAPVLVGFALWSGTERPDVLISADGKLVGVLSAQGRALSVERGSGFVAKGWLENDGSWVEQAEAAKLWAGIQSQAFTKIRHIRRAKELGAAGCQEGEILVSFKVIETQMPCTVFDPSTLKESGAIAIYFEEHSLKLETARERAGRRLWNVDGRDQ